NGTRLVDLAGGETRTFLEDGDEVVLEARAGAVAFGEAAGTILR
ncbi:MAG: fumarylacetoacetase, partial [Actinobacteria bacterium]|nr:fumarylacetoacetase [Actinomycetota bacterium]NIS29751.1 fumarylacetoacetase [Actinomycetota bacterium]NIU18324.1 fumarylacetoacetase [Actinomycetota bacterium]NIU65067.1 fumarylacetoacetase [Actinomycetota bacterium]NIW26866.1 fumarylacetoacetase [Actinomycetota bacterium]